MNTLYYVDLFCGDGETKDDYTNELWPSPFIENLIKKGIIEERLDIRFLLNDIDADAIKRLKTKLAELNANDKIIDIGNEDANLYVDKALKSIPKDNNWSIFFLDPYRYMHLKWSTVIKISKHYSNPYHKPEMIINLPIFSLINGWKSKSYDGIDEFYGGREWFQKINNYKDTNHDMPVISAFLDCYKEKLAALGYKVESEDVSSMYNQSPVYYVIFAVSNDYANKIVKRVLDSIRKVKYEWINEKREKIEEKDEEIRIDDTRKAGIGKGKLISDYF